MRTCFAMIIMLLLLVSVNDTRGEIFVVDSQMNVDTYNNDLASYSDSSCQFLSMEDDGLKDVSNIFLNGFFFKGEMELVEKNITQISNFNSLRLRKSVDLSTYFKNVMQQLSFRDELLVLDKSKLFHSNINHCVLPSCQYYIITLRRILI